MKPAGGGSAWASPLDASTPAVWWVDASNAGSITKNGLSPDLVSQWNDLSGNGRHLTEASAKPSYDTGILNGLPGIGFGPGAQMLTGAFTLAQPFMLVMVWKQSAVSPSSFGLLFDGHNAQSGGRALVFNRHDGFGGQYLAYAGSGAGQGTIATNTAYRTLAKFAGASSKSVINATDSGTVDLGTDGITNGIMIAGGNSINAYIHEAFVIPNSTPTDETKAAAYTLAKWGV